MHLDFFLMRYKHTYQLYTSLGYELECSTAITNKKSKTFVSATPSIASYRAPLQAMQYIAIVHTYQQAGRAVGQAKCGVWREGLKAQPLPWADNEWEISVFASHSSVKTLVKKNNSRALITPTWYLVQRCVMLKWLMLEPICFAMLILKSHVRLCISDISLKYLAVGLNRHKLRGW